MTFFRPVDGVVLVSSAGDWILGNALPDADDVMEQVELGSRVDRLSFDTAGLGSWDSGLLIFLTKVVALCTQKNILTSKEDLPQGLRKLLDLSSIEHQRKGIVRKVGRKNFFVRVADGTSDFVRGSKEALTFIGEASASLCKLLTRRAAFRRSDLLTIIQDTGAQSLPIVSLISALVGLILAFVVCPARGRIKNPSYGCRTLRKR